MSRVYYFWISVPAANSQDLTSSDHVACESDSGVLRIIGHADPVEGWKGEDVY